MVDPTDRRSQPQGFFRKGLESRPRAAPLPVKPGEQGHITSRASSERPKKCMLVWASTFVRWLAPMRQPRRLERNCPEQVLECPTNIKGDLGWSCPGWG